MTRVVVFVCCWLMATTTLAQPQPWRSVPEASRLQFQATWEGEPLEGRFRDFTVELQPGTGDGEIASLRVEVDVTSLTTPMPDVDEAMAEPDWFFFAHYPRAVYSAPEVRALGEGRYRAEGTLTLKGVSRPLAVPFQWARDGGGGRLRGELAMDRTAFGIGEGEWEAGDPIGLEVQLRFDVQMTR
jgi:polyisoprenoid-binding protein YceI